MTVLDGILENINNKSLHFVFPSAVLAKFWAQQSALKSRKAVALNRFIAWDDFKTAALSIKKQDQYPANRALRLIFASDLLGSNALNKASFLHEYINPDYVDSYSSFASPLAALLPALKVIAERLNTQKSTHDNYFQDLLLIKERYTQFLQKNKIYEPSWNKAPFQPESGKLYMLFFPELCEDWYEYNEELSNAQSIDIVHLENIEAPRLPAKQEEAVKSILGGYEGCFIHFPFSADEYKWLAFTVRRLLDEADLSYEDISITIAGENNPERLVHEFWLNDIKVCLHQRKALLAHPGGRIFTHLSECRGKKWSYQSLKNLLLDKAFTWKDTHFINALMEAGIKYRCVSNFTDHHIEYDTWDRSLWEESEQSFAGVPVPEIKQFYRQLKKSIDSCLNARSFSELRSRWYAFETTYFDSKTFSAQTSHIIKEIMKALNALIAMEDRFPSLIQEADKRPCFSIFQSYIQETVIGNEQDTHAIALYGYKVAAGIGTPLHFIVNTNQNDTTVVYNGGAGFLREDRRASLSMQNRDMSSEFIGAYRSTTPFPVFTVSNRTFSGVVVPSRLCDAKIKEAVFDKENDCYEIEWNFALQKGKVAPKSVQMQGWHAYNVIKAEQSEEDFSHELIKDEALKKSLIRRLGKQKYFRDKACGVEEPCVLTVSVTDLNEYIACPFKWVLEKGLAIQKGQTDIETINQRELGILYHAILALFFTRLKKVQNRFRAEDMSEYAKILSHVVKETLLDAEHKEGFFQKSIYAMVEERIKSALLYYLNNDKETLNGSEIVGAEHSLRKVYEGDIVLSGIADLILFNEEGTYSIVDYKTGSLPGKKDISMEDDEEFPKNVQMASYVAMLEESGATVSAAHFYSLDKRVFRRVIGEGAVSRQDYEGAIKAVDKVFKSLYSALLSGDYRADSVDRKTCMHCEVASVCRIPYSFS